MTQSCLRVHQNAWNMTSWKFFFKAPWTPYLGSRPEFPVPPWTPKAIFKFSYPLAPRQTYHNGLALSHHVILVSFSNKLVNVNSWIEVRTLETTLQAPAVHVLRHLFPLLSILRGHPATTNGPSKPTATLITLYYYYASTVGEPLEIISKVCHHPSPWWRHR